MGVQRSAVSLLACSSPRKSASEVWEAKAPRDRAGHGAASQGRPLAILLCFVFFSQFKPSEPFLVDYFVDTKGFAIREVYTSIFSLYAYGQLPAMIVVGMLSQMRWCDGRCGGNRWVLIGGAACGLVTVLLTRFGETLATQQAAQFTVAASISSQLVVSAFALALVPPERYQETCHVVKAVLLLSNCLAAVVGEVLRDTLGISPSVLFDISGVCQALTLIFAVCLPRPEKEEGLGIMGDADPMCWQALPPDVEDVEVAGTCAKCRCTGVVQHMHECLGELCVMLRLRGVLWWTAWGVAMNPAHGLVMTYWQSLLRVRGLKRDHNGYLLASMYLAAAVLLLATRKKAFFSRCATAFVVGSMLLAGALLCLLVAASSEATMYCWLFLYQCLFQVMCVVRTFHIGAEVAQAFGDSSSHLQPGARLSLLFTVAAVGFNVSEALMQAVINMLGLQPLEGIGCLLAACAVLLGIVRCGEALLLKASAGHKCLMAACADALAPTQTAGFGG